VHSADATHAYNFCLPQTKENKNKNRHNRNAGYCEQFDVHSSGATVREAVTESAILRLGKSVSKEQVSWFSVGNLPMAENG
jgi:hypothetical protein